MREKVKVFSILEVWSAELVAKLWLVLQNTDEERPCHPTECVMVIFVEQTSERILEESS